HDAANRLHLYTLSAACRPRTEHLCSIDSGETCRPGTPEAESESMDRDRKRQKRQQRQERRDADWIFASDDPRTLPTDRLPDREEFDRYAAPLLARRAGQAALPGESEPAAEEPDTATGLIPALGPDSEANEEREEPDPTAPLRRPREVTYARSGTTPNAEHEDGGGDGLPLRGIVVPYCFRALGICVALRGVLALVGMVSALATTFARGTIAVMEGFGRAAIAGGLLALVVVHLLRWIPRNPPLPLVRLVRIIGLM